jgi:NitT/TauT family transport system ATP-binding protein
MINPIRPLDFLSISGLKHSFDGALAIDDINCSFAKGSLTAVLGPSGCGKTTLLKCAAGLIRPDFGSICLDGVNPSEARSRGNVGFAFQSPTLLPWRTALQNVLLPLEILRRSDAINMKEQAQQLLNEVGLDEDSSKLSRQLSGGMQQRVGLARALITRPSFLFLDEPFSSLDGMTKDRLNEKLRRLWQEHKLTIVIVTHSIEDAVFLADKIIILTSGPGRISEIVDIGLGDNRDASTRATKEYFEYIKAIRRKTERIT